jgi:hypothetical protein
MHFIDMARWKSRKIHLKKRKKKKNYIYIYTYTRPGKSGISDLTSISKMGKSRIVTGDQISNNSFCCQLSLAPGVGWSSCGIICHSGNYGHCALANVSRTTRVDRYLFYTGARIHNDISKRFCAWPDNSVYLMMDLTFAGDCTAALCGPPL